MFEIVILNYNKLHLTAQCIESIKRESFYKPKITVIDNNSTDNSRDWLKIKGINTIERKQNELFTIPYADYLATNKEKYVCIMNNDIVVTKDWDKPLMDLIQRKEVGLVAPMLLSPDMQTIQNMGGLDDFCSHKGGHPNNYKTIEENLWTTFACVIIKMEAYNKIGGFDRQFLFYCSDSDLCIRLNLAGYKIYNHPESKVIHFHGQTTRQEQQKGSNIMQIGQQDQLKFNAKWQTHGITIGQQKQVTTRIKL